MLWIMAGCVVLILIILVKAIIGPTVIDRLISINAITSKISVIILLLAFAKGEYGYIDVAFVFILCGFVGGLWILGVLTSGDWKLKKTGIEVFNEERKGSVK